MIKPEQLFRQAKPTDAGQSTLDRPLDHLMACHRRIEDRLDTLQRAGDHLGTRLAEALGAVHSSLRFFDSNGVLHTEDEEQSVFPRLRPRLRDQDRDYVASLEQQHDEADALYAELKEIVGKLDAGAADARLIERYQATVSRLASLYREHIASEDDALVRLGREHFTEDELRQISAEMKRRRGL